ncbi:MAG: hypothetical protein M0Z54_02625 [Thermaerobacter sp.]|nr:hypothetical protein [Thermaerobacter sp.]
MWERVIVVAIHPGDWCRVSGFFVLPPLVVAVWLLNRAPLSGPLVAQWAAAAAAFLVVRWLMAHWYNATRRWRGRQAMELWISGPQLESARTYRALAVGAWGIPGAWLFGLALYAVGLLTFLGSSWVWAVGVGGPALQMVMMAGSAGLYTRVVGGVSTTLAAEWLPADGGAKGPWSRIGAVDPARARTVVATLVFAWVVAASGISIALLMVGLTVLARHVPAGYFGLGVAVFVGFALAGLGLVAAVLMGLWARTAARLYNRWVGRGGGLRWQVERRQFPVG